jgi:hypothetical protein
VPPDVHAQDPLGERLGLVGRLGELDPAGLAAPAGQDLRLDDDRLADLLGDLARLLGRAGDFARRDRNAARAQQLLGLVLVKVQRSLLSAGQDRTASDSGRGSTFWS